MMELRELERILNEQRIPVGVMKNLKNIINNSRENSIAGIVMMSYGLGVMNGKQEERRRRNRKGTI